MADDESRDQLGDLPQRGSQQKSRRQDPSSSSSESWSSGTTASSAPTFSSFGDLTWEEVNMYFHGLAGDPKLLARSSTDPFETKHDGTFLKKKRVFNVGRHPIVQTYDHGPRMEIRTALQDIKWIKVDIVRLGYEDMAAQNPVVVLITAEKGTVPVWKAQDAVRKCRQILQNYQLDVHAEMMESEKISLGFCDQNPLPIFPYQRIPHIGQSIGPTVHGPHQASGTLGLYITLRKPGVDPKRCALTCHRVAFPEGIQNPPAGINKPFEANSTPATLMDQPSTQDHNSMMNYLEEIAMYNENLVDRLRDKQRKADLGLGSQLSEREQSNISVFQELSENATRDHNSIKTFPRKLGSVFATSGIHIDPKHGNTVDWGLVDLDKQRFNEIPLNQVPDFNFTEAQIMKMNTKLKTEDWFNPHEIESTLTTRVSLKEVLSSKVEDTDGFPSFRVIKYGRSTHFTVGISNELVSDCQREHGLISKEWCIVDQDVRGGGAFSDAGDSGAIVFDYKGRIAGMLHGGGVPKSSGKSMTYVTPIEWLIENIEESLGATVHLR